MCLYQPVCLSVCAFVCLSLFVSGWPVLVPALPQRATVALQTAHTVALTKRRKDHLRKDTKTKKTKDKAGLATTGHCCPPDGTHCCSHEKTKRPLMKRHKDKKDNKTKPGHCCPPDSTGLCTVLSTHCCFQEKTKRQKDTKTQIQKEKTKSGLPQRATVAPPDGTHCCSSKPSTPIPMTILIKLYWVWSRPGP